MRDRLKRAIKPFACLVAVVLAVYVVAEQAMLRRIRSELNNIHPNGYAILGLRTGGEVAEIPNLWRMLSLAYTYRYSGRYLPEGSGGFTGKKNYLLMMVSDNQAIYLHTWSFRMFGLDPDYSRPGRNDIIANLPDDSRWLYQFNAAKRFRRKGLWFCGSHVNHPDLKYYWRPMSEEANVRFARDDGPN